MKGMPRKRGGRHGTPAGPIPQTHPLPVPGPGQAKMHMAGAAWTPVAACVGRVGCPLLGTAKFVWAGRWVPQSLSGRGAGYCKVCLGGALGTAQAFPTPSVRPRSFAQAKRPAEHKIQGSAGVCHAYPPASGAFPSQRQALAANACVARDHSRFAKASRKIGFHANPLGWAALNQRS